LKVFSPRLIISQLPQQSGGPIPNAHCFGNLLAVRGCEHVVCRAAFAMRGSGIPLSTSEKQLCNSMEN
jgi:hypothetical protein